MRKLNLRLFDEGASAAPAEAAQSVNDGDATITGESNTGDSATPERPSFKDLIKGDYKAEADEYIQGLMDKRFKAHKDMETKMRAQDEILATVAGKYNVDAANLDALREAVMNDDSLYEERAMQEGLTVEQLKRVEQAEAKNRMYEAQQQQLQAQQQVSVWQQQAADVKKNFPDFDLNSELQNDTFRRQLQLGIDMQSAYVAAHQAEILQGAMQYTAQEVRKATAQEIASRGQRPRENAQAGQAASTAGKDVSKLTRADREALSRRAMAGEIITFS